MLSKVSALRTGKNKKGFTLVELVIVIAVLAILAAIAIPTVKNVIDNANASADASNAQTIELALKTTASRIKSGQYTSDTATLANTTVSAALSENGVGISLTELKQGTGYHFLVTKATGKVEATDTEAGTDTVVLAADQFLSDVVPNT